jgi:hypothetical protein
MCVNILFEIKFYILNFVFVSKTLTMGIMANIRIYLTVSTEDEKLEVIALHLLYSHSNHQKLWPLCCPTQLGI